MPQTNPLVSVVDDDRSMSRMLHRLITAAGLDVASFGSAEEFLNSGALRDSACVILDMNLPGICPGVPVQGLNLRAAGVR